MTLVIEESEDISFELLSPLLASVKNDNEVFAALIDNWLFSTSSFFFYNFFSDCFLDSPGYSTNFSEVGGKSN